MLLAIEGIDGSGKGTQAGRLRDRLADEGVAVALVSFPRYDHTLFGGAIGEFLNGAFGELDAVDPFLASLLYAGDRFESRDHLTDLLARHQLVICDRYVASNLAHQGAKATGEARRELLARIDRIEHEINGLPRADQTVLLDISPDHSQELIARKSARSYTDRKVDLQEADTSYLGGVAEVYRELATGENWTTVPCEKGNDLRTVEAINNDLHAIAQELLNGGAEPLP